MTGNRSTHRNLILILSLNDKGGEVVVVVVGGGGGGGALRGHVTPFLVKAGTVEDINSGYSIQIGMIDPDHTESA